MMMVYGLYGYFRYFVFVVCDTFCKLHTSHCVLYCKRLHMSQNGLCHRWINACTQTYIKNINLHLMRRLKAEGGKHNSGLFSYLCYVSVAIAIFYSFEIGSRFADVLGMIEEAVNK